jgi:cobalt-zinc-cadmium efflux system membrane fusion protein
MKFFMLFISFHLVIGANNLCFAGDGHNHGHGHGHGEHEEEPAKGTQGGKLFEKGDFSVEVTIFEENVPPQFRVYAYSKQSMLPAEKVKVSIELKRFSRETEQFILAPAGDYLTSEQVVEEPHSFDVTLKAEFDGEKYDWHYSSHEGRTELSKAALKVAQLAFDKAGPRDISNNIRVYGKLLPNENNVAHIVPRFPGVVKDISKMLGDSVEKGEVLAIIESNQSLQPYEIRSQIDGVVVKRHATKGEFVSDSREIFIVADLSEVWADFQVYRDDIEPIELGQEIEIDFDDASQAAAKISYISPIIDEATQSKLVRAVLENPSGKLRPGLFVSGVITSKLTTVPIAVKREALQKFRDWDVVYITDGHSFQAMPVELGRKDRNFVEVLSGLEPGDKYVTRNSYIIKADIEKSGASHDH